MWIRTSQIHFSIVDSENLEKILNLIYIEAKSLIFLLIFSTE